MRNLLNAEGANTTFQLVDPSDFTAWSSVKKTNCPGDWRETSNARILQRKSGDILTGLTIKSSSLLLAEFSSDLSSVNSYYSTSFGSSYSYIYSMEENVDKQHIYVLIGQL